MKERLRSLLNVNEEVALEIWCKIHPREALAHERRLLLSDDGDGENKISRTNVIDNIYTLNNPTKAGVNAVEVLSVHTVVADEKLRTTGVLTPVGHRKHTPIVVLTLGVGLARNRVAGTTRTIADGATTLNHKVGNYTVESEAVVEPRSGKFDKVIYGDGGLFLVEFHLHITLFGGN